MKTSAQKHGLFFNVKNVFVILSLTKTLWWPLCYYRYWKHVYITARLRPQDGITIIMCRFYDNAFKRHPIFGYADSISRLLSLSPLHYNITCSTFTILLQVPWLWTWSDACPTIIRSRYTVQIICIFSLCAKSFNSADCVVIVPLSCVHIKSLNQRCCLG